MNIIVNIILNIMNTIVNIMNDMNYEIHNFPFRALTKPCPRGSWCECHSDTVPLSVPRKVNIIPSAQTPSDLIKL